MAATMITLTTTSKPFAMMSSLLVLTEPRNALRASTRSAKLLSSGSRPAPTKTERLASRPLTSAFDDLPYYAIYSLRKAAYL
jgi:hypothetical protein